MGRINLRVPYEEKEEVKNQGQNGTEIYGFGTFQKTLAMKHSVNGCCCQILKQSHFQ